MMVANGPLRTLAKITVAAAQLPHTGPSCHCAARSKIPRSAVRDFRDGARAAPVDQVLQGTPPAPSAAQWHDVSLLRSPKYILSQSGSRAWDRLFANNRDHRPTQIFERLVANLELRVRIRDEHGRDPGRSAFRLDHRDEVARVASAARLVEDQPGVLDLGAQLPSPEWGAMLGDALELIYVAPWTVMLPGAAIMVSVLLINLLGDGIRRAINAGVQ